MMLQIKIILMFLLLFFNHLLFAQWVETGKKISILPADYSLVILPFTQNGNICSDKNGGAVIVWMNATQNQIRIQRIDKFGYTLWQEGGIVIAKNSGSAQVVNTADSNFVIIWVSSGFPGNLYAQKFNLKGEVLWSDSGISVCDVSLTQYYPQAAATNDGGVVITWMDFRSNHSSDIYAQRISSDGSLLWQSDGLPICIFPSYQNFPRIAHLGDNKFVIVWQDARNFYFNIMGNLIDASGSKLWGANDKSIFTQPGNSHFPKLIVDNNGFSYVVWEHNTRGLYVVRAQKIDVNGNLVWGEGVFPVDSTLNTNHPFLASDGKGGLYVSWVDNFTPSRFSVQHIKFDGTLAYGDSGIQISNNSNQNLWPNLISDEKMGCIITWNEYNSFINKIRMHKIDNRGSLAWGNDGIELGTESGDGQYQQFTLTDSGNIIIVWTDKRENDQTHLYASMVSPYGNIATDMNEINLENPTEFLLKQNFPNPFNPITKIRWQSPVGGKQTLKVYDLLGVEAATLVDEYREAGSYEIEFDASSLSSGVYFYMLRAGDFVETKKMILMK
jgi:hypothetical protein